jgi:uncharacterized membrane protein
MGLTIMIVGLLLFLGVHAFVTRREQRAQAIARWGEGPYKLGFSVISALGLALIVYGFARYRATGWIDIWLPPPWTRHVAVALTLPAIVFVVAAYIPGHIKRALKHPMLAGVKLWALAHLLANGDLGSIILFGSILVWAVYDRVSLKHRSDPGAPPTSVSGWRNDVIAIIVGVLAYLALGFIFHPLVLGVPAFTA